MRGDDTKERAHRVNKPWRAWLVMLPAKDSARGESALANRTNRSLRTKKETLNVSE